MKPSILIVAGDVSGDLHAGAVVRAWQQRGLNAELWGIGGDRLRAAGAELLYDVRQTAIMGFLEVLRHAGLVRRMWRDILRRVQSRPPDLAILVDYPGFNLRLARALKHRGLRVLYFICPQVWAWHSSRIWTLAQTVDRLLVIFPFERELFRDTGLTVDFVGHPFVDELTAFTAAPLNEWGSGQPRVGLLPGSRRQEVRRILPTLLAAAEQVRIRHPNAAFIVAAANDVTAELARRLIAQRSSRSVRSPVVVGRTRDVLRQATAAWVASGTATLEAALLECPQVIVYRAHPLSYLLGRCLIRVPYIGMVNLVAGRGICPELIQHEATAVRLADAIEPLLTDTSQRQAMLFGYQEVRTKLGQPGAAARAAEILDQELRAALARSRIASP
jgi:lipid-A-disaccharide synthase